MSKLSIVGIGPGDLRHMTYAAREAIESAEVIVGYSTYIDFIRPIISGKEIVSTGMTREVERCREAIRIASAGKNVALISSGDAGIYGMAGLVLELGGASCISSFRKGEQGGICNAEENKIPLNPPLQKGDLKTPHQGDVEIVVIPGVSAVQAAAAVLGAPLMHDFAVISLSDLLTPWELIVKRLHAAAAADFVVALYNPKSKGRQRQIEEAREIFLSFRPASTPVGIVRNACRDGEEKLVTTLADMLSHDIDMFSIVIIGNCSTYVDEKGRMVTPRGYAAKANGTRVKAKGKDTAFGPSPLALRQGGKGAVMFCGTASDVGKSVLTAGFCRILKNRGFRVAPFKSQNMALNSAVTPEGGEIGRAQGVQAEACGIPSHIDMNPILLKPNSDTGSQVIVQGKVVGNMTVAQYNAYKPEAFIKVKESYQRLSGQYEFIVIEGAGSIAEINLKAHDIANLKVAEMADCPVILVADIDRGGVFAQVVGTLELLEPQERRRVKGVIINKFRGDASLLTPGIEFVEKRTGVPVLGVVPYFTGFKIPDEDSVALSRKAKGEGPRAGGEKICIGVVKLPRISNFTDFEPLESEPDVELRYVEGVSQVAGLDVLILPGSKSTIADLYFLMERGLYDAVKSFSGIIVGICGGYQMLGHRVLDPLGVESHIREAVGLGLLDVETVMCSEKTTHGAVAELLSGGSLAAPDCTGRLSGYEIHMGETSVGVGVQPFARITSRSEKHVEINDGAVSGDGRVFGTYLHGIFDNNCFRSAFLNRIRLKKGMTVPVADVADQDPFDLLAAHIERHVDVEKLFELCAIRL